MKIDIETLRKTKGIGSKTLERIIEQHNIDNNIKAFKSKYIPSDKYKVDKDINLWQGDCLELMSHIPDKSIDMVLCDLPYGTTACSWDEVIPFEPLWSHYKRIIKDDGAIVLFGSEPFSTKLRMSNLEWYRYDWVWVKDKPSNFFMGKKAPLKYTEDICVFYKHLPTYNPIMQKRDDENKRKNKLTSSLLKDETKGINEYTDKYQKRLLSGISDYIYPRNYQFFNNRRDAGFHPTQKPVELCEYLIKTYTNEGMTVLDNAMGSGSTGVACKNLNRRFIGMELDETYFNIAKERIEKVR